MARRLTCDLTLDQVAVFSGSWVSPSLARAYVREHVCPTHGVAAVGALALVTSELVTNAVIHGSPPITLRLRCLITELRLTIADKAPSWPDGGDTSTHNGLGLQIVADIAKDWGVTPYQGGKEVWCRVPTGVVPSQREWDLMHAPPPTPDA